MLLVAAIPRMLIDVDAHSDDVSVVVRQGYGGDTQKVDDVRKLRMRG
jgi:hypothetical protein